MATLNPRYAGPARARDGWPWSWANGMTLSAMRRWPRRCGKPTTVLQGNRKTQEGNQHKDRDAQFHHINATVRKELAHGRPVISVDTQEEGTDRELREQGNPVAGQRPAPARSTAMTSPGRTSTRGLSLWHLRCRPEQRVCECGDRPRHRHVRGGLHPGLVAGARTKALPRRQKTDDHRRWWRQQRLSPAAVED